MVERAGAEERARGVVAGCVCCACVVCAGVCVVRVFARSWLHTGCTPTAHRLHTGCSPSAGILSIEAAFSHQPIAIMIANMGSGAHLTPWLFRLFVGPTTSPAGRARLHVGGAASEPAMQKAEARPKPVVIIKTWSFTPMG